MSTETADQPWTLSGEDAERLWDAIATVRDASPRLPDDADTQDIVDALAPLIEQQVRKAQAAEMRRITTEVVVQAPRPGHFTDWDRGWNAARDMLTARAGELDPA